VNAAGEGRTGRRPGQASSREDILEASRTLFASRGYDGASLRAIAAAAGVDPGVIRHFFGDKAGLFEETVVQQFGTSVTFTDALSDLSPGIGERISRSYLAMWDDPVSGPRTMALMRTTLGSEAAMERLRAVMLRSLIAGARPREISPEQAVRINLVLATLLGVAIARHLVRLPPLALLPLDAVIAAVAPEIEHLLTGAG
jgi:AcrR family transcriptional regulator